MLGSPRGIFWVWVGGSQVVGFGLGRVAKPDSRPCGFRPPSWRPTYFLLLVQEKVTKENTPSAPRRSRSERFRRTNGFFPQAIHDLLKKSARSLAPPTCGARAFPFA